MTWKGWKTIRLEINYNNTEVIPAENPSFFDIMIKSAEAAMELRI